MQNLIQICNVMWFKSYEHFHYLITDGQADSRSDNTKCTPSDHLITMKKDKCGMLVINGLKGLSCRSVAFDLGLYPQKGRMAYMG